MNRARRQEQVYQARMADNHRVIVIGSGPSGATAALRLLERGIPVTLLESGPAFRAGLIVRAFGRNLFRKWASSAETYRFSASGEPGTEWPNALTPGGLSNYWTGVVPRFVPQDFTEGERLHERYVWPLSYADLAPYYTYAERLVGVVGERAAIAQVSPPTVVAHERHLPNAWRSIAVQTERMGQGLRYAPIADGPSWLVRRSGVAFNSFDRIVRGLSRFPHFELRLGAHAQRLTWNSAVGRVDGVEYLDRATGTLQRLAASAVVVGAGPLASPKLLLQSTSRDFPTGLGNTHGVLGHFLHDHPKDWCVLHLDRPLPRLDQPLHLSRLPHAESAPLMGAAITIGPLSKWDRVVSFAGLGATSFGVVTFATMVPEERNQLSLHPLERDQFGMPILDIHMRYAKEVMPTIAAAHARLLKALAQAGLQASLECPMDHLTPGSSAHYGGAARMHHSPQYGVLDGWNQVHGASNVVVVDASSFTTAVEKNPTLTVMALAARAADRVADDLRNLSPGRDNQPLHAVPTLR
jgi:choline dehydrogenase-like flavoprotein